jgi:hypothetical protein
MKIIIDEKIIEEFCKTNGIKKLSFFGSSLSDNSVEGSDVDILVEFYEDSVPGFLGIARLERELSEIIGKKVDLRTKEELSKYFRDRVIKEAEVKYGY